MFQYKIQNEKRLKICGNDNICTIINVFMIISMVQIIKREFSALKESRTLDLHITNVML